MPGAGGCERIRLFLQRDSANPLTIVDFSLETTGCPSGEYKKGEGAAAKCLPYPPGFWCASDTKCQSPPDPCGGPEYYCLGHAGGGLRQVVEEGYISSPPDADPGKRTGQQLSPTGHMAPAVRPRPGAAIPCIPGTFAAILGSTSCDTCIPGRYAAEPGKSDCDACPAGFYRSEGRSEKDAEQCIACSERAQVCPTPGMDKPAECMSSDFRHAVNNSRVPNRMVAVPAKNRIGRVRCQW